MKKIFISIAAILCMASTVSAQTLIVVEEKPVLTNKRGVRILPQAGEMGIGVSATPFLSYFGNMFTSNGTNNAPTFMSKGAGLNFKFFTTDNQAIRAGVTLNYGNDYFYGYPQGNAGVGTTVMDQKRVSDQLFGINIGYEWRRGMGRLQGFAGVQLGASYSRQKTVYSYGNDFSATHTTPYSWNFNTNQQFQATERTLETAGAPNISVGLMGFVGVEYFFAPKMSIGGELGLGLGYVNQGDSEFKSQSWDAANAKVVETKVKRHDPNVANDGFVLSTMTQGNIFLSFYF